MKVDFYTLNDNTSGRWDLRAEWGLSILVQVEGLNILMDAGQGEATLYNADAMKLDMGKLDKVVWSHGHVDHTVGLRPILARAKKEIEVVAHPQALAPKYALRPKQKERTVYIGLPYMREELERLGARFVLHREPTWLSEHVLTTGEIPQETSYERVDEEVRVMAASGLVPDTLPDDQALIYPHTGAGRIAGANTNTLILAA